MSHSINDLLLNMKFDNPNITYNLDSAYAKWDGESTVGTPKDFFDTRSDLNSTWQTAFASVMSLWDAYSNLSISSVTGATDANIYAYRSDVVDQPGATAWFDNLSTGSVYDGSNIGDGYQRSEFVFDNSAITGYDATPHFREYILLHEIGHALGLKGDAPISEQYTTDMTVMSYAIPGSGYSESGYLSIGDARFAITPMAYDIAALESIYGSFNTNTGDNVYNASWFAGYGVDGSNHIAMTLVDTGGIDTIDFSGINGNHIIDLREAIDSNDVWQDAATIINDNTGASNDGEYIFIARGSVIENAIGSDGDDVIHGNDVDNTLTGGEGSDALDGGDGIDMASYANSNVTISVDVAGNAVYQGSDVDSLTSVERILGSGSMFDTLDLSNHSWAGAYELYFQLDAQGKAYAAINAGVANLVTSAADVELLEFSDTGNKFDIDLVSGSAISSIDTAGGNDDVTITLEPYGGPGNYSALREVCIHTAH